MDDNGIDTLLIAEVRRRLGEGTAPSEVFAQLAEDASDGRAVALAVCLAIGIPRFEAAMSEFDVVRSGPGFGYYRAVRMGRLHEALVMLSRPERMHRDIDTKTYWGRLVEAVEMLGSDGSAEYVEAIERCRNRLARSR